MRLVHPRGSLTGDVESDAVVLTPQEAGWTYIGLRVLTLLPGVERTVRTGDAEVFVLPLSGGLRVAVTAESAPGESEATYDLVGRDSVFTRVTDFAYAGRDSVLTLLSVDGAEVALPSAVCERRRPPAYGPADEVPVEVRGAGERPGR